MPVKGRGVFTTKAIPPGTIVLKFEGPVYTVDTCPEFSESIQVGPNAWMWSSGGLDDLVNHVRAGGRGGGRRRPPPPLTPPSPVLRAQHWPVDRPRGHLPHHPAPAGGG